METRFVAESLLPNLKERHRAAAGDILWLAHSHYDLGQGRLHMDFTFIRDGQVEKKSGFGQVHTYQEFCRMIEAAGFQAIEGYASPAQEPYRLAAPELFLVATKQGS
jgi:hypothetical protein